VRDFNSLVDEIHKLRRAAAAPAPQLEIGDYDDPVQFWMMVADGVNHDPRCVNHFACPDVKHARECLRCEAERLRAAAPAPPATPTAMPQRDQSPLVRYARLDDDSVEFDEVVATNATVHLEKMNDRQFFLGVENSVGRVSVFLGAKRAHVAGSVSETEGDVRIDRPDSGAHNA
jgi:hypothetical protein